MNAPATNYGEIDPAAPPPLVANCKKHGHAPDSFVLTTEDGSFEHYTCRICRILWREPLE